MMSTPREFASKNEDKRVAEEAFIKKLSDAVSSITSENMHKVETTEQEQEYIAKVKSETRDLLQQLGYWKGSENSLFTVYALMELAFEVSPDAGYFDEVCAEVVYMATEQPQSILENF